MNLDPVLIKTVLPGAGLALLCLVAMTTLRWRRGRMLAEDTAGMRARIAAAAPDAGLLVRQSAAPQRQGQGSSFVGLDT